MRISLIKDEEKYYKGNKRTITRKIDQNSHFPPSTS